MSDVTDIQALVEGTNKPKVTTIEVQRGDEKAQLLVVPDGETFEVKSIKVHLDEYRDKPERRSGTAKLEDLASFIAHANRFKSEHSALFAQRQPPSVQCVFDYHEKTHQGAPAFRAHRGRYEFPLSDEWKAWNQGQGNAYGQREFALFIENRLLDVADPASALSSAQEFAAKLGCVFALPQKLLELSRGLTVNVESTVAQSVNLGSGEGRLTFKEQHSDEHGAPLHVPGAFIIAIPVFKSGALYQVPVRLRYRAHSGKVTWTYELFGVDRMFDHAFQEACELAQRQTELPLFVGSPE